MYHVIVVQTHFKLLNLNVPIIEDCAQAHGATIDGKHVGTIGNIGCFSMYPGKNLGALGDAGICITNNETLSIIMKQYASLGAQKDNRYNHTTDGINSRMDGIQGLLLVKMYITFTILYKMIEMII